MRISSRRRRSSAEQSASRVPRPSKARVCTTWPISIWPRMIFGVCSTCWRGFKTRFRSTYSFGRSSGHAFLALTQDPFTKIAQGFQSAIPGLDTPHQFRVQDHVPIIAWELGRDSVGQNDSGSGDESPHLDCFDSLSFSIPGRNLALHLQRTTLEGVSKRGFHPRAGDANQRVTRSWRRGQEVAPCQHRFRKQ